MKRDLGEPVDTFKLLSLQIRLQDRARAIVNLAAGVGARISFIVSFCPALKNNLTLMHTIKDQP